MLTNDMIPVRFLGERVQLAFVVNDLEAAMRFWTGVLKVGPFVVIEQARGGRDIFYRGDETNGDFSLAFAYMGDVQIELVQPLDDEPSIYKEFLGSGREGLHHLAFWPEDFKAACAHLEANGFQECTSIRMRDGTINVAYYDAPAGVGTFVEVAPLTKERFSYFSRIQRLSQSWDGETRPIRRFKDRGAFLASDEGIE